VAVARLGGAAVDVTRRAPRSHDVHNTSAEGAPACHAVGMAGVSFIESAIAGARGRAADGRRLPGVVEEFQGQYLLGLAALVAAYYASAHLGYALGFSGPVAAIVWLPVGVGIAFLYLAGLRFWPGVLIGDLLVNNYAALPVGSAIGQTVGNVLEIVLAAALMRRLLPRDAPLASVPAVATVVLSIAVGCTVSASIGVGSLELGSVIQRSAPRVWRTWVLGDFSGAVIIVPFALAWFSGSTPGWFRGRVLEGSLLLGAVVGLSLVGLVDGRPLSYIVFPALIWAALRFGQRGSTLAILLASAFTVWGTTHFHGPFVFHSISRTVLNAQVYLVVTAVSTLTLAAVVSERQALSRRLQASRARLIDAADIERRRLERDIHDGTQQRLVALAAHLGLSAEEVREKPWRAEALFESAQAELSVAINELRALAHGIHPPVLSRYGLISAVGTISGTSTVPIDLIDPPTVRLDDGSESTAYFVVAEAVTNAQKYARASRIRVRFELRPGVVAVEITDDGVGGAAEHAGLGLEGLRDRVEGIGGRFEIDSPFGRGTRVYAEIPAAPRPAA
jgi:signal transduction histidine kinase